MDSNDKRLENLGIIAAYVGEPFSKQDVIDKYLKHKKKKKDDKEE